MSCNITTGTMMTLWAALLLLSPLFIHPLIHWVTMQSDQGTEACGCEAKAGLHSAGMIQGRCYGKLQARVYFFAFFPGFVTVNVPATFFPSCPSPVSNSWFLQSCCDFWERECWCASGYHTLESWQMAPGRNWSWIYVPYSQTLCS